MSYAVYFHAGMDNEQNLRDLGHDLLQLDIWAGDEQKGDEYVKAVIDWVKAYVSKSSIDIPVLSSSEAPKAYIGKETALEHVDIYTLAGGIWIHVDETRFPIPTGVYELIAHMDVTQVSNHLLAEAFGPDPSVVSWGDWLRHTEKCPVCKAVHTRFVELGIPIPQDEDPLITVSLGATIFAMR